MRALRQIAPTPEQLAILSRVRQGVEIIRGAAGSGKTTTSLLKLKSLIGFFLGRRKRESSSAPIRVLVLTFNRTLRGYIEALTQEQAVGSVGVKLEVETFARWARRTLGSPSILSQTARDSKLLELGSGLGLPERFLLDETDYVLGRFLPSDVKNYLSVPRHGRGASPRMERDKRKTLVDTVLDPYTSWKAGRGQYDWNDLSVLLAEGTQTPTYDIVVADEVQDFSANQIRAILKHVAPVHSVTFVIDSAQRIYARGFTWQEAGVAIRPENTRRLGRNYRNTIEIARLAASLIAGLPVDDDGTIPDFATCTRRGALPTVLVGRFRRQMDWVLKYLGTIDLSKESVAFLHPLGGGWFNEIRRALTEANFSFVEITKESEWPRGTENIALSTLHSSKGLEFDHVIIIGLNAEVTVHGASDDDDHLGKLRRLLAVGIGRARLSATLGYKPDEASQLVDFLDPETFVGISL